MLHSIDNINDILKLAAEEELYWQERLAAIPAFHPRNESGGSGGAGGSGGTGTGGTGSEGGSGGAGGSGGGSGGGKEDDDDDDDDDDDAAAGKKDIDWKAMARKHERQAKKAARERDEVKSKLTERETADQTEHEKAVAKAREEGETTARTEAEKERRSDRLENATLKLAGKKFKLTVKDGDEDKEITVSFADSDDATTYIERMIRRGDIDEDDLFDDKGKVNNEVLTEALTDLLSEKPHLRAGDSNGSPGTGRQKVKGGADSGRGSGSGKEVEEMSAEEHFERIRRNK